MSEMLFQNIISLGTYNCGEVELFIPFCRPQLQLGRADSTRFCGSDYGLVYGTMPLGNQSHGQQNGLNAPWLQSSHPQLSPDGASRSFSEWQADQYAAPAFTGYHEATPVVQHQFSSIPFHFQHLNLDDVTSATIDSMANTQAPLFPTTSDVLHQPGNGGLLGGLGGSNRPSTATESLLPTIERTSGALPKSSVPTMPMPQRKSRARQPSPEEWENHKAIIEHFYLKQNFSLADTMEELGTVHEFFAT